MADQQIETCGFSLNEKGEKVYNKDYVPHKGQNEPKPLVIKEIETVVVEEEVEQEISSNPLKEIDQNNEDDKKKEARQKMVEKGLQ